MESGFVDLQVNGYAGIDFNSDDVTTGDYRLACDRLRSDGNAGILATIITDTLDRMEHRIKNIVHARHEDSEVADMIFGIHIEGPFLNEQPGYIGAHPAHASRAADVDSTQRLLDAAEGLTKIVTLAPERDSKFRVTRMLADAAVVVSGGHCNPSTEQLQGAIDAGLSMFTHLGNGCPLKMHRHDNIIQRVLNLSKYLNIGFIADGVHVPFVALANYLPVADFDRAFVVTDAVAAAGQGPGTFVLAGHQVVVDESLATWAEDRSHLVGSASTMVRVKQNLTEQLGLTPEQIAMLTRTNPLKAVGS